MAIKPVSLPSFTFQITGQVRVSLRSTTRCARGSLQASCVRRLCAAPPLDGPGATPARCVQPSLSPADEASSPTYALELAKVSEPSARVHQIAHPVVWAPFTALRGSASVDGAFNPKLFPRGALSSLMMRGLATDSLSSGHLANYC